MSRSTVKGSAGAQSWTSVLCFHGLYSDQCSLCILDFSLAQMKSSLLYYANQGTLRVNDGEICFKSNLLVPAKFLRQRPTQLMENCSTGRHQNCLQNPESSILLFCGLEDNVSLENWKHIFEQKLKVTKIQICTLWVYKQKISLLAGFSTCVFQICMQ